MVITVLLQPNEIAELDKQEPETASKGGFQSLIVGLQLRIDRSVGALHLTEDDLRRIPKYAFKYQNGGWENRLRRAFGRVLGLTLSGDLPG